MGVYFVTGTDTGIGKTAATGYLAKKVWESGRTAITQKLVQTGCKGISEDILTHRKIMGVPLTKFDRELITCPAVYSFPCSPHLASRIDQVPLDLRKIRACTKTLAENFDEVFLEGAGGIMVPLEGDYLTIDYVAEEDFKVILVCSSKLGGINHALLSINACKNRNVRIAKVLYNDYPKNTPVIADDAQSYLQEYLKTSYPDADFELLPKIEF